MTIGENYHLNGNGCNQLVSDMRVKGTLSVGLVQDQSRDNQHGSTFASLQNRTYLYTLKTTEEIRPVRQLRTQLVRLKGKKRPSLGRVFFYVLYRS